MHCLGELHSKQGQNRNLSCDISNSLSSDERPDEAFAHALSVSEESVNKIDNVSWVLSRARMNNSGLIQLLRRQLFSTRQDFATTPRVSWLLCLLYGAGTSLCSRQKDELKSYESGQRMKLNTRCRCSRQGTYSHPLRRSYHQAAPPYLRYCCGSSP